MPTNTDQSITYTEPELCTYEEDTSKAWFVYFDITDVLTGVTLRKQFRSGINYWPSIEDRKREGNALRKMWRKKLEEGKYNPFRRPGTDIIAAPKNIHEALERVIALKRALKKRSIAKYSEVSRLFLRWLTENSLHKLPLNKYTHEIAQAYLDHLLIVKNYNGQTYNNNLSKLRSIFKTMTEKARRWISSNAFDEISFQPTDIGKNVAYTIEERGQLIAFLKTNDLRVYYAANFTFHAFIRKSELCELQVNQIDWTHRTIRINSDEAKNRIQDSVTIPEELLSIMYEMGLHKAPGHYYIYGKGLQTCADKCTRPDNISDRHLKVKTKLIALMASVPGKVVDQFSNIHKSQINWKAPLSLDSCIAKSTIRVYFSTTLRLDDEKAYYSWKHAGVIAYWGVVNDPYYMMRQLRHHDLQITMIYLKSLGLMPNEAFIKAKVAI